MEKIKCACGKEVKQASMPTHLKSKKHRTYVENPGYIRFLKPTTVSFN